MDTEIREFVGKEAKGCKVSNTISIELGKSYNGSGPNAFGGAKEWPYLRIEIPFQVGEEERMKTIADMIEKKLKLSGLILPERN